jgi:hypothetical protein
MLKLCVWCSGFVVACSCHVVDGTTEIGCTRVTGRAIYEEQLKLDVLELLVEQYMKHLDLTRQTGKYKYCLTNYITLNGKEIILKIQHINENLKIVYIYMKRNCNFTVCHLTYNK